MLALSLLAPRSCYSVDRVLLDCVQASPAAQLADNIMATGSSTWAAISSRLTPLLKSDSTGAAAADMAVRAEEEQSLLQVRLALRHVRRKNYKTSG